MSEFLLALGLAMGLPLLLSGMTAFARPRSRLDWLLSALLSAGVSVYMVLAGAVWVWIGLGWRILPLAASAVAVLWSSRRLRARPALPPARPLPMVGVALRCAMVALRPSRTSISTRCGAARPIRGRCSQPPMPCR